MDLDHDLKTRVTCVVCVMLRDRDRATTPTQTDRLDEKRKSRRRQIWVVPVVEAHNGTIIRVGPPRDRSSAPDDEVLQEIQGSTHLRNT